MLRCQQQADNQCQKSDSELFILTVLETAGTDYILRLQYSMLHLAHRPLMGQQQTRALTACVQLQSEPQLCFTRPNDGRARHHRQAMSRNVPDKTSQVLFQEASLPARRYGMTRQQDVSLRIWGPAW